MPTTIPETRSKTQCMRVVFPLFYFVWFYLDAQAQTTGCPLPLEAYLDHAWSTAGLMGAVPWMADFLRMMKWDEISAQVTTNICLTREAIASSPPALRFPLICSLCLRRVGMYQSNVRCLCSPPSLTTRSTLLACFPHT